jgi:hypothetical protein
MRVTTIWLLEDGMPGTFRRTEPYEFLSCEKSSKLILNTAVSPACTPDTNHRPGPTPQAPPHTEAKAIVRRAPRRFICFPKDVMTPKSWTILLETKSKENKKLRLAKWTVLS